MPNLSRTRLPRQPSTSWWRTVATNGRSSKLPREWTLAYARGTGSEINLLKAAETGPWTVFTVPNSLREVEVGSNLLLREDDPSDDPAAEFLQPPPPVANGEVEADAGLTIEAAAGDADEVDDADVQLDPDEAVL